MQKNKEIMSWLKNTWTKHRDNWITVAEMWGRRILLERWPPVKRNGKTTPDILRMGKKRISDKWNNSRGWYEARTTKLRENGQDWEEKLFFGLQMTTRNTTKITEILRENEKRRGWANNEMIWNRSWKGIWLMESILTSHLKRIENNSGGIRRVR